MLQANTIPCYWEMKEKSKYKLDKEDIAGDPIEDPDDKYVIRQEDFEVPMREGSMLLLLYDEDREDFVRIPAVPSETRVTPSKVENNRFCKTFEASENYQPLVDKLAIMTFSTGKKRANKSHIVQIAPTGGVLDSPLRLLADLEVDAVFSNRTTGVARTFTAKKSVLLHSQPMRVIKTSEDEREYLEHDEKTFKQLERIMLKIEKSWPDRLFSLHNMIERMIEGYDYRFGYDEHQVKTAIDMYIDFIEGRFEGANGTPYKVTYADELKACYAFVQGLRDNTGILGRMAMGVLTGGVSEHVFTTMTVLEKIQQEIYTCKDANDFTAFSALKIGASELGKQVAIEITLNGLGQIAGEVAKAKNIDVQGTLQMWAGKYRSAMDGADLWLTKNSSLYRAGDTAFRNCKNFLGSGSGTAAKAITNVTKANEKAAVRAEKLLEKARKNMTAEDLANAKLYENAMANGAKKVRKLENIRKTLESVKKKGSAKSIENWERKFKEASDDVWVDKCALKKLQDLDTPGAKDLRKSFNEYREGVFDQVQKDAIKEISAKNKIPEDELYVMNASNNSKKNVIDGTKTPGDRDVSINRKVGSDRTMDVTIGQREGEEAVARQLWKRLHNGKEPPDIEAALKLMRERDISYVNPKGDSNKYFSDHNLDGYEDLSGMVGMKPDGTIDKSLLAKDLHNPYLNAASVKHKGVEWFATRANEKFALADKLEAQAAGLNGSAKAAMLEQAEQVRYLAIGDINEGIRQITKQTDNIIIPRGLARNCTNPLPDNLLELHQLAKRVGKDVSPAEFARALKNQKLDLVTWADAVSKYVNVKAAPAAPLTVSPSVYMPGANKAMDDAVNRAKKER